MMKSPNIAENQPSNKIRMTSLRIWTVVNRARTEKRNVQIGSANFQAGWKTMKFQTNLNFNQETTYRN